MVGSYQRSGNAARKKSLAGARSAVKKQIPEIIIKSLDKAPALRERCLCTVMGSRTGVILLRSVVRQVEILETVCQDALHDGLVLVDQVGSVLLEAVARNVVICACGNQFNFHQKKIPRMIQEKSSRTLIAAPWGPDY